MRFGLILVLTCGLCPLAAQDPCAKPLDLNTATVKELERLPGVGRARAEMIVRVRSANGLFKSVEELQALPRLTKKQFQVLRKCLTLGGTEPSRQAPPETTSERP